MPNPNPRPSDDLNELLDRGLRYALSLTHDRSDAEDLLQDAAAAMLARGVEWNIDYLFATIRNRFIDRCRRTQRVTFVPQESHTSAANACDAREPVDCLSTCIAPSVPYVTMSARRCSCRWSKASPPKILRASPVVREERSGIFRAKRKLRTVLEESSAFVHLSRACAS